jgi:hypothetical protein
MARVSYFIDKNKSNNLQISAHQNNSYLLKPKNNMHTLHIDFINHNRNDNINRWISQHDNYNDLILDVNDGVSRSLLIQPVDLSSEIFISLLHILPGPSLARAQRSEAVGEAELRPRQGWAGSPLSAFTPVGGRALFAV